MAHETAAVTPESFWDRHHFLLRRLHSLCGLVPVGVFVVVHILTNASIMTGVEMFEKNVERIHALEPLLVPVEIFGIFLPLLFHSLLGFQIWFSGKPNLGAYKYGGNYRYTMQRVTGGIAFLFIMYHLWQMHWLGKPFGGGYFVPTPGRMAESAAGAIQQTIVGVPVSYLYVIGVLATVFHLANGIWTSLITWGVTIGPLSQRISGYACTVFGMALACAGLGAVNGFKEFKALSKVVQSGGATSAETVANDGYDHR